jgi:hypothetical protein
MKTSGTTLEDYHRNTNKKRCYGHVSRMNENMIKETNWKIHKKETEIKM